VVRRYDDPIEVRTADDAGPNRHDPNQPDPNQPHPNQPDLGEPDPNQPDPGEPVAFIWRDRLYVVRSVLACWYERRAWWREAAAANLLGLRADGRTSTLPPVGATRLPGAERAVWRVEACAGRSGPGGVYDLMHDPQRRDQQHGVNETGGGGDGWRLVRLAD
jgi:hypothetical protein